MVIGGLEPRRTPAVADVSVERRRPHHKAEGVDLRQVDTHLLPAAPRAVAPAPAAALRDAAIRGALPIGHVCRDDEIQPALAPGRHDVGVDV